MLVACANLYHRSEISLAPVRILHGEFLECGDRDWWLGIVLGHYVSGEDSDSRELMCELSLSLLLFELENQKDILLRRGDDDMYDIKL